jgi:hypothetical protein
MTCPGQPSRIDPKRILWMCTGQGSQKACARFSYDSTELVPAAEWSPSSGWECPAYQPVEDRGAK